MKHRIFSVTDAVVIFIIAAIAVLIFAMGFIFSGYGKTVTVTVNSETVAELPLNKNAEIPLDTDYGKNTIVIKNGKCYISFADCRDNICVKHSSISKKGESIVCLPHRLIAEVK